MFHKRSSLCFVQHNEDGALAARQVRIGDLRPTCSEGLLSALSVDGPTHTVPDVDVGSGLGAVMGRFSHYV